jgi:hypothetical protein
LVGDAVLPEQTSLHDFWRWAFSDLCDDDIKGIFAEWMVSKLLDLSSDRRVSWANSDLVTPTGKRIEVKASAYWQSWKLVNEDGTRKPVPPPVDPARAVIQFGGLQARTAVLPASSADVRGFKSDIYVFCLHTQEDASAWDAWRLSHWQFYVLTREQLLERKVGRTISLAMLCKICSAMNAREFQEFMKPLLTGASYFK